MKLPPLQGSRKLVLLFSAGLLLLLCIAPLEYLFIPLAVEVPAGFVYRIAYLAVLPFRALVIPFLPHVDHHWSVPHTVVVCLGTPFFYGLLFGIGRRFLRTRLAGGAPPASEPRLPVPRRAFLRNSFLAAAGTALGGVGAHATLVAPQRLRVRNYELPIADLPPALDGLRLIHVSDTHYGPFVSLAYLRHAVAKANELEGDLVLLTGDYVHRSDKAIEPGIEIFASLKSRFGAVAVFGNHEHWEGAARCRAAFEGIGIPLLDNTRLFLNEEGLHEDSARDSSLCVAGVGDLWEDEVSLEKALGGVPVSTPRLLLSHNPDVAETLGPEHRVDAMFSGHTHGGQIRPPFLRPYARVTQYGIKYIGGLCYGPYCPVIVSRAVGLAGIPIRFRVDPEIGVIRLKRA